MDTESMTLGAAACYVAGKLGKPVVDEGVRLIHDLLGESFKVAGGMLGDQFYEFRIGNVISIANRLKPKLEAAGIAPRKVVTGFLLNALEAASTVDDETMQDLWANLLAAGVADDENQHPMYIDWLKRMNSADAKKLRQIRENPQTVPIGGADLPASRLVALGLVGLLTGPEGPRLTTVGTRFYQIVSGEATVKR